VLACLGPAVLSVLGAAAQEPGVVGVAGGHDASPVVPIWMPVRSESTTELLGEGCECRRAGLALC